MRSLIKTYSLYKLLLIVQVLVFANSVYMLFPFSRWNEKGTCAHPSIHMYHIGSETVDSIPAMTTTVFPMMEWHSWTVESRKRQCEVDKTRELVEKDSLDSIGILPCLQGFPDPPKL